ncbi:MULTISPECIES: TM0106 family RecB-like putative nuclease [unclassified Gordonia (in: high G+C Gram-positive bacteria)]|uniref:TM0106 family RecB-like putative nuclease n=1 Tax=unclassified Gordonia (in: high G+C Gram-positive bacteria) TaxID=2657482 RepID=UPI001F0E171B|nr:TM0106 family RecB-like putative nuclease [Gordonia sp. ABSL49_1]MCH5642888.1 TM0106 family RecB-like putative nuclease [Gordonia sp. ABSL49_1]
MPAVVLAPRDLAGCEHRLALDFEHPVLVGDRRDAPGVLRRKEAAASLRSAVGELLRGIHSDHPETFVAISPDADAAARARATLDACAAGARWIWNATLPVDLEAGRRGHAELLIAHGDGYVPVIVVNHRVTQAAKTILSEEVRAPSLVTSPLWVWAPNPDPYRTGRPNRRDALRLAHLVAMLDELGLGSTADPQDAVGGVIGMDADCIVVHAVGRTLDDYGRVLERRKRIAAQAVPTVARRVGECRSCPWWGRCEPELVERRDVSLVASGNQWNALEDIGIQTIDQLAHYHGDAPDRWPGNVRFDDAIVNAIAWLTDTALVRRVDEPTVVRADVEVDVDMESFGEHGAYLWGTLLTDNTEPDVMVRYRPFVTWDPLPTTDEARSFAEFWSWLIGVREAAHGAGKTFAAYCYSEQAENRWLLASADRFAGSPGIPSRADVEAFIASPEWVDIYAAVGRNFICPNGKGLKRVAPVAGFAWRDDDAGGEASMEWYSAAVGLGPGPVDLTQRARLLEYNEDDVRATKVLREWITDRAANDVPHERELLAFRAGPDAASGPHVAESVEERTAAQEGERAE